MSLLIFTIPVQKIKKNHDTNSTPGPNNNYNLPPANLFSSSVFPMALAAWHICLSSSSSLLMQRMILPSNTSVILHMWENAAPCMELAISILIPANISGYTIFGSYNYTQNYNMINAPMHLVPRCPDLFQHNPCTSSCQTLQRFVCLHCLVH